jgi:hypothetical protein
MNQQQPSDRWYYAKDKKKFGPVSLAQLQCLVAEGKLKPEDMVIQDGAQKWRSLVEVITIKPCAKPRTRGLAIVGVMAGATVLTAFVCCGSVAFLSLRNDTGFTDIWTSHGEESRGAKQAGSPNEEGGDRTDQPQKVNSDVAEAKDERQGKLFQLPPVNPGIPQGGLQWSTYFSAEGHCAIMFPGKPEIKVGETTVVQLELLDGKARYMLAFTVFQNEIAGADNEFIKKTFDDARDGMLALKGTKIQQEKDSRVEGYPARDIDCDLPGLGIVPSLGIYRARWVITPQVLYQIVVFGPKDFVETAHAKKFQESFRVKAAERSPLKDKLKERVR